MPWLMVAPFVGMSAAMVVGWWVQRAQNNGGWTDVFWSFAMGLVGAAVALAPRGAPTARQVLVAGLVLVWGLRLGSHIRARVLTSPEDARYAKFRHEWAPRFQVMMFAFLQVQALAGGLLLLSVIAAARNPAPSLGPRDFVGAIMLVVAIFGEGAADAQLKGFAHDPANRGKVCDVGLWSWSRHPNYFFEWFGWLAYPLIAIDFSGSYWWGWIALSAPICMYWLLRYASGVPPLEEHMLRSRGAAFAAYQARVSIFFPLPPRPAPLPHGSRPS